MQVTSQRTPLGNTTAKSAFPHVRQQEPALDPAVFGGLRAMLAGSVVAQIYREFLQHTRSRLHALAADPGPRSLREAGHTIKGTAGMLGAPELAASAMLLEQPSITGEEAQRTIKRMLEGCATLEAALIVEQVAL